MYILTENAIANFFSSFVMFIGLAVLLFFMWRRSLTRYILKRIMMMIPIAIIISIMLFFGLFAMSEDPLAATYQNCLQTNLENQTICDEEKKALEEYYGLDQPKVVQYFKWLGRVVFEQDFGESYNDGKPVVDKLASRIENSFQLNIVVVIISFSLSIPIGIACAIKKYSFFDNFWMVFSLVAISIPGFFLAETLIQVFVVNLGWFERSASFTGVEHITFMTYVKKWTLPVFAMTIGSLAGTIRYVRTSLLDVLKQDYIRTARAKGLSEPKVIFGHAIRNAMIPIVTIFAGSLPGLFGGSLIIEKTFSYPGIGLMLYEATYGGVTDLPIILAANLFYTMLGLSANILMDITYAFVDPRVVVG